MKATQFDLFAEPPADLAIDDPYDTSDVKETLEAARRRRIIAVEKTQGCSRPIRLTGQIQVSDAGSGELVHHWSSTKDEINGFSYVPCKTRRADKCKSCADLYQG